MSPARGHTRYCNAAPTARSLSSAHCLLCAGISLSAISRAPQGQGARANGRSFLEKSNVVVSERTVVMPAVTPSRTARCAGECSAGGQYCHETRQTISELIGSCLSYSRACNKSTSISIGSASAHLIMSKRKHVTAVTASEGRNSYDAGIVRLPLLPDSGREFLPPES